MIKYRIFLFVLVLIFFQSNAYAQFNLWEKLSGKKQEKEPQKTVSEKERRKAESHFAEGMKAFLLENYSKAIEEFEKAKNITPHEPAIHYKIADSYMEKGNYYKAEGYAHKALELNDDNKYYYVLLADIYKQKQEFDRAAKIYNRLLNNISGTEEHYFDLAAIYVYQGNYKKALEVYNKIEKHYGLNDKIVFQKQKIYLKLGNLEKAIEEGEKLIKAHPDEPKYVINQAEIYLSNDKTEKAKEILFKLLENKPNNQKARIMLANVYRREEKTDKFFNELKIAFQSKELSLDNKIDVLIKYVRQQNPGDSVDHDLVKLGKILVDEHPDKAGSHAMYADILSIDGQDEKALSYYLKSINVDEDQFKIWQQVIRLEDRLKMNDSLIKHTSEAMEIFPNQGVFYFYNGFANYREKDFKKAVKALEESKKLYTGNKQMKMQVNSMLGDCYYEMGKYAKSDSAFEAVLEQDPDNPTALNNYSYYLSERNERLEYAKNLSTKALRKDPNNATFIDTYGWILYKMGEYEKSKEIFDRIIDDTDNGTIVEHYGDILYKIGEKEKAIEQWKRAKELGDASKHIDKKIEERKLYE